MYFFTFTHFRILLIFQKDVIVLLGLGGAAVAFPLQHVADHHPQQAQQEEHGHQDEGDVVRFAHSSTFSGHCSCRCGNERDFLFRCVFVATGSRALENKTTHCRYNALDGNLISTLTPSILPEACVEQLRGFKFYQLQHGRAFMFPSWISRVGCRLRSVTQTCCVFVPQHSVQEADWRLTVSVE